MLVGCSALGIGGERGWAPDDETGNFGSEAEGKAGVAGDGLLPFRWFRLDPPMWLEWFDPEGLPTADGRDILPRGRRKRWSSSSPPPSRAKLREVGGSMVTAVAKHLSAATQEKRRSVKTRTMEAGAPAGQRENGWGGRRSVMDNSWQKEIREKSKLTKRVSRVKKSSHN